MWEGRVDALVVVLVVDVVVGCFWSVITYCTEFPLSKKKKKRAKGS